MRKLITLSALAVACVTMGAVDTNKFARFDRKTTTVEDVQAVYAAMAACTDAADVKTIVAHTMPRLLIGAPQYRDVLKQIDQLVVDKVGAVRYVQGMIPTSPWFPKTGKAYFEARGWDKLRPVTYSLFDRIPNSTTVVWLRSLDNCGVGFVDILTVYAESQAPTRRNDEAGRLRPDLDYGNYVNYVNESKRELQRIALRFIKMHLRAQGKSFVTRDGVNPCEPYMAELSRVLDAPRLNGVNEWLASLGSDRRIDTSAYYTEDEIAAWRDAVFTGAMDMTPGMSGLLYFYLGVDEYNKFVKAYNGDN